MPVGEVRSFELQVCELGYLTAYQTTTLSWPKIGGDRCSEKETAYICVMFFLVKNTRGSVAYLPPPTLSVSVRNLHPRKTGKVT